MRSNQTTRAVLTAAPIVLVAVTVVAGYWLRHHQHRRLGAPTAPMYWFGHTRLEWWALPAAAVLVAAGLLGPWGLRPGRGGVPAAAGGGGAGPPGTPQHKPPRPPPPDRPPGGEEGGPRGPGP